ncbi:putative mRNA export factor [Clavispora lusitaniae]|uniref:mRNA export factor n=1 Tax=Clavispora lusitaniae TaxID=36911 RepID=A0AA91T4A0_CLALS|nr:putative mRNA export factor [Clavispora lusitaniae]
MMSYRGRGRGGFGHNNNFNRNDTQGAGNNNVEMEIYGWNGSTPGDCVAFIARKCKITLTNYSVNTANGALRGFVRSENEAKDLLQWSGVRFAGSPLKISKVPAPNAGFNQPGGSAIPTNSNTSSQNTIETLTMFLKSRYDAQNKLLNLSAVQQDSTLSAKGFFGTISTSSKFFPALMKIAKDLKLEVTSADLSNNNLNDSSTISTLAHSFPMLQNLSLQNNKFTKIKAFESWKKKFNYLRELILTGNPLLNTTNPNDVIHIKQEVLKIFPRLVVFNGEVIRNEQLLNQNLTFPFGDPNAMFFQDNEVQNISTNFITNYFNLWDMNRADLMVLYQNESQFSLQVDATSPHTLDSKGPPDFGYYLPSSRNLTRISSAKVRMGRVAQGQEQIFKLFSQIPKTKHDILGKPDNYSVECYRLQALGAICITIHGKFEETAAPDNLDNLNQSSSGGRSRNSFQKKHKIALGSKSFDRTFIVIPGPNASMIVASDLLCIRVEADSDAFKPPANVLPAVNTSQAPSVSPTPVQGGINPTGRIAGPQTQPILNNATPPPNGPNVAALPAELKANLNQMQQEFLVKILVETKLSMQYALMLCQQSNWDYQQCIVNFKNSASSLPPDAFAQ